MLELHSRLSYSEASERLKSRLPCNGSSRNFKLRMSSLAAEQHWHPLLVTMSTISRIDDYSFWAVPW